MNTFIIEIHPKKQDFDPAARQVKTELLEAGESPDAALVQTRRLYRLEGAFTPEQIETITKTLLVDPVVETFEVENLTPAAKGKKAAKSKGGLMADVWPKPGVTDPVGETVEKGLQDLGFRPPFHATSAHRYVFPKINDTEKIHTIAKRFLANELIHAIDIRQAH